MRFERAYGRAWIKRLKADRPAAVIACNLPLISMFLFARYARRSRLPYVMWHQDIYSAGLSDELRRRLPRLLARLGSTVFVRMEAYCARNASHVVAIGDAFKAVYPGWRVAPENVSVIPNWAPLDKVFPVPRSNHRSTALFDDEDALRLVYAGTLGRKHNPQLLVEILRKALDEDIPAALLVVSEGESADELAAIAAREPDLPLRVVPFEPADSLPDVLGSADVLIALLEPEATSFSIPSKVLSYMAAGRPILGLMPEDNPAAADIVATGGHVAPPDSEGAKGSVAWLADLHTDRTKVASLGRRSREIAEAKFDVSKVAQRFDEILTRSARDSA
jgi:glycosyltransferase involved in cell wall biosynthesis